MKPPTTTIATVIVDDEPLACDELAYLLKSHPEIEIVGQGRNGIEAVSLIKQLEPDLVFLDVQMPGLDGLGVIRRLAERKIPLPHVIFATAFDQYAVQAFEVNAVDYLLKPIDKVRLAKALEKARRLIESHQSPAVEKLEAALDSALSKQPRHAKVVVRTQNRMMLVDPADMIYATIEDGLITVVAKDLEGTANYRTIEELLSFLPADTFWRVHRSYLVNINRIREVVPWFKSTFLLKMDDKKQTEIPVSRAQTRRLRELLKL
jgi:two-component system LytT family response regulator/two-component system response regulator LytT